MKLDAYLFFNGTCEEALKFYRDALGGDFEISRFEGSPMAENMPPEERSRVMHSTFRGSGFEFMASDGLDAAPSGGHPSVVLTLSTNDEAEGRRVFDALSAGGTVEMPFEKTFWGAVFGRLTDRFGQGWMINAGP